MESSTQSSKQAPWAIVIIIITVIISLVIWQFLQEPEPVIEEIIEAPIVEVVEPEPELVVEVVEPEAALPVVEEPVVEQEIVPPLPLLDESDAWVQEKLPQLTWRKELLKLVINEDMIRRFVVFTDNFSQGLIAYEHSPFVKPVTSFSVNEIDVIEGENGERWQWDEQATRRFSLYVDLLRSIDVNTLVLWFDEMRPLIDEAYQELGYPDAEFTDTLQDAITRVLDMEIPKEKIMLTRPSVMYKYADPKLQELDDADKLLLRLGRENLLVIKSILLEINEKLSRLSR